MKPETSPLTPEQKKRVEDNLPLVALHLNRRGPRVDRPRRDREWEDLFQEGCLGLIEAARRYREDRNIPFAAFALARIHGATSKALHTKFQTVKAPADELKGGAPRREEWVADRHDPAARRPVASCELESPAREAANRAADARHAGGPAEEPIRDFESIGDRIRGKYERAVKTAGAVLSRSASRRGDRAKLVRQLIRERFLVPQAESRRALRQIARDTGSSYARVAQCDQQLGEAARKLLEKDVEFVLLMGRARTSGEGFSTPVDKPLERALMRRGVAEFLRLFDGLPVARRAEMVWRVLRVSRCDISDLLRSKLERLREPVREQLLREAREAGSR